ncbi:MAG: hypothetical protein ACRC4G_00625 [Alphaproteobacteria bacterium]
MNLPKDDENDEGFVLVDFEDSEKINIDFIEIFEKYKSQLKAINEKTFWDLTNKAGAWENDRERASVDVWAR